MSGGRYETTCPGCGQRVLEVGLIMPFELDGETVHGGCTTLVMTSSN